MKTVSSFKHGYKTYKAGLASHIKEYESRIETEKWTGQLNEEASWEAPAMSLEVLQQEQEQKN